MLRLKFGIISIIKAISTCTSSGKRMCLLDVDGRFSLSVQRCRSISLVCRCVLTMLSGKILCECDESSSTVSLTL